MNRIKLVAVMLMTATMVMSQTTKKSFTLNDLLGGGSTYWNLQPKYMFTAWWGEQPLEDRLATSIFQEELVEN